MLQYPLSINSPSWKLKRNKRDTAHGRSERRKREDDCSISEKELNELLDELKRECQGPPGPPGFQG